MSPLAGPRRRGALLATSLAAAALVLAVRLPGAVDAAAFLGPACLLLLLLALGRYPGERALLSVARRSRVRVTVGATRAYRRITANMPRGGALLASALAGRAPPPISRPL